MIRNAIAGALILFAATAVQAEGGLTERAVKIVGRSSVTVTTPILRLGDLAEVSSPLARDDDTVIGLQKIYVDRSPAPGSDTTLSATAVLEKLSAQGVDLSKVSYTLPRVITVKRAARPLLKEEIRAAIESALQTSRSDVAVRDVRYSGERFVSPGEVVIEASALNSGTPGTRNFTINVFAKGEQPARFEVSATVDEWEMMPVANRSVSRGSVVQPQDVVMARVNLASLPIDVMRHDNDVIGLEASRDIPFGEVFRKDKLSIPPLVTAGSKVTMAYRNGPFEATATGIALESGIRGQATLSLFVTN